MASLNKKIYKKIRFIDIVTVVCFFILVLCTIMLCHMILMGIFSPLAIACMKKFPIFEIFVYKLIELLFIYGLLFVLFIAYYFIVYYISSNQNNNKN